MKEQLTPEVKKATFKELRDIREILGQISDENRKKFVDLLKKVGEANFKFKDLINILEEDNGEYVGSWVKPNNTEKE